MLNIIGIIFMVVSIVTSTALFFLSGVIIILLATNSIIHAKNGSSDIFSPLFISTMAIIVACSIGAILRYLTSTYPEGILNKALLYVIFFAISFVLGFSTHIGNVLSRSLPRLKPDFSVKRLKLVTVLLPEAYLEGLDELVRANMYPSRSSAIRSSVRDLLKKELWERRGR